jgi:hypothetical protein
MVIPSTTPRTEEHRHEQVDEQGGCTRPDTEDVGAPVRGGRRTRAAATCRTTVAARRMTTSTRETLAERYLYSRARWWTETSEVAKPGDNQRWWSHLE